MDGKYSSDSPYVVKHLEAKYAFASSLLQLSAAHRLSYCKGE